jgi:hypothetical protein
MAIHDRWPGHRGLVLTTGLLLAAPVGARQPSAPAPATDRLTVTAVPLASGEEISVDGRLEEQAWQRAAPAADFRQSEPRNGELATERTEVRIMFSRDALYIGVVLFDSEPEKLLGNQMARDGSLASDDRFMWTLDPFDTQRSGYYFELNPAGAMGDAQIVPPQGATAQSTTQNRAWDGIWFARVGRSDDGWAAEIEIPFRTLNFDPRAEAWGANFQRTVQRKNEESFWQGWGRNQGLSNLAASGRIVGIREVSQGRGLDVVPYAIGTYLDEPFGDVRSRYEGEGGLDLFYSLTPQLKMNLTVNTDFAQTDVDDRQVNLTRFPLFFPEKRAFFLEGAGNFDFAREARQNLTAFFSRRIGLTDAGQPQTIDYGLRLIGQAGQYDLGLMQVRTGTERDALGEDFTVFRPKRRFWSQSYAGLIYTRRATRNSNAPDRHTIGADFQLATARFRGTQNLRFGGFFIKTPTPATRGGNDAAWGLRVDYPNDLWTVHFNYSDFQENMNPAVGFTERSGFQRVFGAFQFAPRPRNSRRIRQITMRVTPELYSDRNGNWVDRSYDIRYFTLNLQSGDTVNLSLVPRYEYPYDSFRIAGILLPGKEYRYTRYSAGLSTATRRKISGEMTVTTGTFYSGHRDDVSAVLNVRPQRGWLATLSGTISRIELDEGSVSTQVLRAVVNTQFSPFLSVSNNVQYDSVSSILGWQFRFRWILRPGNDIYVVWLNNWEETGGRMTTLDRSLATKVIYTYRF